MVICARDIEIVDEPELCVIVVRYIDAPRDER